ncbi:ras-like protein family member 10B isoform X4 [Symsagittifera roscoffensis]|uniref:ras-like protein family member 10B isoform X3 n=1 Tax=Symsagittifera roscoffensis TaxID=84072 RepID=UPI00307CC4A3
MRDAMPKRRATVAVLGASSVGKSSLIHQFMFCHLHHLNHPAPTSNPANHLSSAPRSSSAPTRSEKQPQAHHPNLFVNQSLYEVTIVDPPHCKDEDMFNMHEWAQLQFSCVNAHLAEAFVLVYDVSSPLTFKYIQVLREQINESFEGTSDAVVPPILVVGNKCDISKRAYPLHVVSEIVKKHWHCEYMECSAKYNCRVFGVFREIMMMVDACENSPGGGLHHHGNQNFSRVQSLFNQPFNHNWGSFTRRQSRYFSQFAQHNSSYRRKRRQSLSVYIPSLNKKGQSSNCSESSSNLTNSINSRIRGYLSSCMSRTA